MLTSLVEATGLRLIVDLAEPPSGPGALSGPVGRRLRDDREVLLSKVAEFGIGRLRVFGSVARGEETADSDVDLLVDLPAGAGLFALGRLRAHLEQIIGRRVDLVPEAGLKPEFRRNIEADLVLL
jgi:predicted nucleotidyltransferase